MAEEDEDAVRRSSTVSNGYIANGTPSQLYRRGSNMSEYVQPTKFQRHGINDSQRKLPDRRRDGPR